MLERECTQGRFVKAVDFKLTGEETAYLEELYVPHALVGVIAMNPVEIQAKFPAKPSCLLPHPEAAAWERRMKASRQAGF